MSAIVEVKPTVRMMQNELAQWGKWARHASYNPSELTYTSPTYGLMRLKEGQKSSGIQVMLDDDALVAVDHLVTQLRFSRPDLYQWIEFHYLKGYSIAVLASKTKVARYKIDGYLLAAESWLDCRLNDLVASVN
ncbi:antiterminator Q family protein [Acinetobacter sp. YH01006]|uniref:antiterminator Q family protein n=1 Tax=Acinetobacter sp. YH01006 TaxID=2601022 RepID=UPI0015D2DBEE|nr:antiterminator Q family protein [Acinetobacter sp. YH01006]